MARSHDAHVHWKHLAIYGVVVTVALVIGALVLWSFFQKQTLVVDPEPLPKVTVVAVDPNSKLAAAWVSLLTKAGLQATLVPLEKLDRVGGVMLFCDVPAIPSRLIPAIEALAGHGGPLVFAGAPPATAIGGVRLSTKPGPSDSSIKLSEASSPILARLDPGSEVPMQRTLVPLLEESPQMVIDARWGDHARAAVMHMEEHGTRFVWIGFDPDALMQKENPQVTVMLRTAFRWAAGQPVSEGAAGAEVLAKSFTAESRRAARAQRFAFGVDRLSNRRLFLLHVTNRGSKVIENPSVEVWMPPRTTNVAVAGELFMKTNVTITSIPEERAWVISMSRLTPGEDRLIKLKIDTLQP